MTDNPPFWARTSLAVVILLIISFVAWAAITQVEEIARGEGKVIPVSRTQIIQASEASVVQEIAVRVGQIVKKGDLIVRLDDTATTSTLGELEARARALRVQIARLELEQTGDMMSPMICPEVVRKTSPEVCDNEGQLLKARRDSFQNKLSVLQERHLQRRGELDEALVGIQRLEANIKISQKESALLEPLVARKLAPQTDLLRIQKELTDSNGQLKLLQESLDRIRGSIKEASLQVDELMLVFQQEALAEKTKVLADLSVVLETIRGASDRVQRTDLRSPVDGVVNRLEITTIGAYVQPGTVVAEVVPTSDVLLVEARISPKDVAFIRIGQPALVKITAFDFSIYGGLPGEVSNVSADSMFDEKSGETFYLVQVKTDKSEISHDGKAHSIIPGMVASVDVMTGKKTVLQYLLKPINKARTEAMRER
ncbi:secretion protein HylD [Mesorhizobium sp. Root157]|uniref:HlyD family type I secretion periplasmic adaptor subunit n=1 Tax=Mesorhizobium sp. Root157 TaxID=1736477 RepID=UPI0006FA5225|nr:HlyD family type I secretion periplasmic adaptor subunit [Mesorhizobium sp. Root157]KQZ99592.1 secretion protein HylD [Mesorhizobium sp. Root157]